jgi:SNF family Na+-dependent transporter
LGKTDEPTVLPVFIICSGVHAGIKNYQSRLMPLILLISQLKKAGTQKNLSEILI